MIGILSFGDGALGTFLVLTAIALITYAVEVVHDRH